MINSQRAFHFSLFTPCSVRGFWRVLPQCSGDSACKHRTWISAQTSISPVYTFTQSGAFRSSALLRRANLRLHLDKLLRHLVCGPLGQDAHHRHARLVGLNARPQGTPAHAALSVGDVSQLDHGHADHPVRPAEAVVLHRHLQLVAVWGLLTQHTTEQRRVYTRWEATISPKIVHLFVGKLRFSNSQLEGLVELRRPAVVLGLCGELALLVGKVRADHADFHERSEHPRRLPLHVVHCNDWEQRRKSRDSVE